MQPSLLARRRPFLPVSHPPDIRRGRGSEVRIPESDGFTDLEARTVRGHRVERDVLPANPAVEGLCHVGADLSGSLLLGSVPLLAIVVRVEMIYGVLPGLVECLLADPRSLDACLEMALITVLEADTCIVSTKATPLKSRSANDFWAGAQTAPASQRLRPRSFLKSSLAYRQPIGVPRRL